MASPLIISPDEIKTFFPSYTPDKAEKFHTESAKLADKWFKTAVEIIPAPVLVLAGGSASGKTEYLSQYVKIHAYGIFFDGTLPTFKGACIKIDHVLACNRQLDIHFILPRDLRKAFLVFLGRERKFNQTHFYRTHSESRHTILEIFSYYPTVNVRIIESMFNTNSDTMDFIEKTFVSRPEKFDYLRSIQYTQKEIIKLVL